MKIGKSWIILLVTVLLTIAATVLFSIKGFLVMMVLLILVALYNLYPLVCCMKAGKKFNEGDNEGCVHYFEKAYKCHRATPMVILTYAYQLIRMSNTKRAEFILNDLLNSKKKLKPNEVLMAKQNLSLVMYKTERFAEAKEIMEDVFSESQTTGTYGTLGYYKILSDGFADSLVFCEKAYSYNDTDPVIADNLLTVYMGLDRYEDAKAVVDHIMKTDKNKILELFYHAAQIEEKIGDVAAAEHYLGMAKEQNRSFLTTVSEEDIGVLEELIQKKIQAKNLPPDNFDTKAE